MSVAGYVILTLKFEKEKGGKRWLARCVELGTSTFGNTLEEARERIEEAILCHLNTLEDVGERERFLKECNIKIHLVKPKQPITLRAKTEPGIFLQTYIQSLRDLIHA